MLAKYSSIVTKALHLTLRIAVIIPSSDCKTWLFTGSLGEKKSTIVSKIFRKHKPTAVRRISEDINVWLSEDVQKKKHQYVARFFTIPKKYVQICELMTVRGKYTEIYN